MSDKYWVHGRKNDKWKSSGPLTYDEAKHRASMLRLSGHTDVMISSKSRP